MFLATSETFDVSYMTFLNIYIGRAKAPPPPPPLCWPSLKGFAFPLSIKSSFLSKNRNRKNRAKVTCNQV